MNCVWCHQSNSPENIGFLLPALHIAHIKNIIITIKIIQNKSIFDSNKIKVNLDRLAGWLALHCQKVFGDLKIWRLNLESAISTRDTQQFDSANRMFLLSKSPFYSFRLSRIFVLAVWAHSYDFHLIAKKKSSKFRSTHLFCFIYCPIFIRYFISSLYFTATLVLCYWYLCADD